MRRIEWSYLCQIQSTHRSFIWKDIFRIDLSKSFIVKISSTSLVFLIREYLIVSSKYFSIFISSIGLFICIYLYIYIFFFSSRNERILQITHVHRLYQIISSYCVISLGNSTSMLLIVCLRCSKLITNHHSLFHDLLLMIEESCMISIYVNHLIKNLLHLYRLWWNRVSFLKTHYCFRFFFIWRSAVFQKEIS